MGMISVIMPAYNSARFIVKSISSVQNQTFHDWELIVVDDLSSDETCELVEALAKEDSRIRLVRLNRNFGGPAGPRNVGIHNARFDCIAFLDSDDIWHPQKLEKQIELFDSSQETFSCSSMVDFSDDAVISFPEVSEVNVESVKFIDQSVRAKIPTSSVLVSKSLMNKFPFEESPDYKAVEDFHCWLRILSSGIFCKKIKEPLLFYRRSDGQISGSKLKMMKKVFMVHNNFKGRGPLTSLLFTASHVLGGVYFRFFKKGM